MNKVEELVERGKAKGVLTYKEVMDTLEELDLNSEQIELFHLVHVRFIRFQSCPLLTVTNLRCV